MSRFPSQRKTVHLFHFNAYGRAAPKGLPAQPAPADAADSNVVDVADAAPTFAVYAHSATTLYRFDVEAKSLVAVGRFSCAGDVVNKLWPWRPWVAGGYFSPLWFVPLWCS